MLLEKVVQMPDMTVMVRQVMRICLRPNLSAKSPKDMAEIMTPTKDMDSTKGKAHSPPQARSKSDMIVVP